MNMHSFAFGHRDPFCIAGVVAICLIAASTAGAADQSNGKVVSKFLGQYCIQCHDADKAEGEREFESFSLPITDEQELIAVNEIINQVTLRQMPPEDAEQPPDEQRLVLLTALRDSVLEARQHFESTGARTVIRRLTHREYENTLATLFGRRVDTLGLTADFPQDETSQHMDNIGASLVTSGFLLDQYFQAASRLVESRLGTSDKEPQSWHFTDNFRQYEELSGAHKSVFKYEYLCLYEQPNTDTRQGGYGHIEDFLEGVPVSGLYNIEVHAQAMHRDTHYDPKIFRIDFSEPFQIAVVPGDATKGHIHYPQAIEPILASAIVPDEAPEWLSFRVWLEAGQTPRFIFPNGPYESRASVIQINKRYKEEFKDVKNASGIRRAHMLRTGALPHIKIGEIKINGPIAEPDGVKEELAVFGTNGFEPDCAVEQVLGFAQRAYRRPLNQTDRNSIETLYHQRVSEGATPRQAALDTLKMILCSPSFLYLSEITPEDERELHPFDLASRLSYALWAAPPDDELFAVAESGQLTGSDELKKQVSRLLSDERSSELVSGFLDSWLNLRSLGDLPPPRTFAWEYYAQNLPESMKQEVHLFFRHLLDENKPVSEFLDADYAFVDKNLASLYQLPARETLRLADGFQRVSLTEDDQRGGLLGMAAVLTVSADGVGTSPVTRGAWVLESLLGTPPPPPPDEVPEIESDTSGATTIREKLARHSSDQACSICHRKIDPLGYALESYDPIGRWRNEYRRTKDDAPAPKVDPSGTFPSGETYEDFAGFKQVLLSSRFDLFTHALIEKLLSYTTGRLMEPSDQYEINEILDRAKADNYGLQTIVVEVLTSETFRSR